MSEGYNKWVGLGNLGADGELKMTQSGQAVLKLRLACSESYVDKNQTKQERTEWVSVSLWGKRAEALAKFMTKGSRILVEGSLRTSTYEKNGEKRYSTEINATDIRFAGGSKGGGVANNDDNDSAPASSAEDPAGPNPVGDDEIPFISSAMWGEPPRQLRRETRWQKF